ncbi:MAG: acetyl-CoA carboxylase biotin carboxyl carrier protein subunit [Pyrinomonadaceae bacterium]
MKLKAHITSEDYDIEIVRDGGLVSAKIGDRTYKLEASEVEPNVYLLKHDNRIFEVRVSNSNDGGHATVTIGRSSFDITLIDPKRLRGSGADHDHGEGLAEIKTAMPGKIVRILVDVGAEVAKGDGVIIVEAMKMQNEIRSPKDGHIRSIAAVEGATVNAGDILVIVE